MKASRVNAIAALCLALLAFGAAQAWRPTVQLSQTRAKVELETMFPKEFGDWTVDRSIPVQLISPDTQAFISKIYNQTLSRTYVNRSGDRIMLSVAYGGDQSDATRAHRPEVCYPAQGFQIIAQQNAVVDIGARTLRVRQLVSRLGGRTEPISYWITVGDRVSLSGTEQKLQQLSYSTRGIVPDGMLVRVSNISTDSPRAFSVQQTFLAALAAAVRPELQAQVFGSTGG